MRQVAILDCAFRSKVNAQIAPSWTRRSVQGEHQDRHGEHL